MSEAATQIFPMFGRLVVERQTRDAVTEGGIIVPRRDQEETSFAKVFATGEVEGLEVGQTVIVTPHSGMDFTFDGMRLTILTEDDVLATVDGEGKE